MASVSKLGAWAPVIAWAALLFGLSSIPGSSIPNVPVPSADKMVHTALYGMFGLLSFRALRRTTRLGPLAAVAAAAALALAYGISDECHQMFVPKRSPDVNDALADLAGGTAGALAAMLFGRLRGGRAS